MKKIYRKKLGLILLIILILIAISTIILAKDFLQPSDIKPTDSDAVKPIQNISGQLLAIIQVVGVAVAVIMLVWIGIKYIAAAPSEKADIKKTAFIYVIGAILIFGATGIIQVFKGAGDSISTEIKNVDNPSKKQAQVVTIYKV